MPKLRNPQLLLKIKTIFLIYPSGSKDVHMLDSFKHTSLLGDKMLNIDNAIITSEYLFRSNEFCCGLILILSFFDIINL